MSDDLNDLADRFFSDRGAGFTSRVSVILAHVGGLGDGGKLPTWASWPLEDQRGQFWAVDPDEREWLKFAPEREAVRGTTGQLDQGSRREHPRCRLLSWQSAQRVYRGEQLALVVAEDSRAAGVLLIFRSEQEVRLTAPGRAVQTPPRAHGVCPAAESAVPVEELHRIARDTCKRLAAVDLCAAVEVHRANCRQPRCPILAAMEAYCAEASPRGAEVTDRGVPGVP